jgi:hypothetical protein
MSEPFAPPPPPPPSIPPPPPIGGDYGAPPAPPPPPTGGGNGSNRAITALVLGILSLVCCQILGPVAWFLGSAELKAIKAGTAPAAGEGVAKAGWILGIVGTVLLGLVALYIVFVIGIAAFSAMLSAGHN